MALSKVLSFVLFLMLFPVYLLDVLRSYSNHKTKNTYVKKILLVDLHLIGDVVMLTPLLLEIKKIYTNASITLLCGDWAEQVLLNNPGLIDCYCIYNAPWVVKDRRKHGWYDLVKKILFLRKQGFDLAIDARGDFRNIAIMRFSCTERRAGFTFSGGGWLLSDKIDDSGNLDHIVSHHHKIALYLGSNISVTKFIPSLWLSSSEANYKSNHAGFIAVHLGASTPLRVLSLERATELKENDGYIIDSLGWGYYVEKNYINAEKFLQRAVELLPFDPIINDHYGDALWMLNKDIQARYIWSSILEMKDAEQQLKDNVEKKLIFGIKRQL